MVRHDTPTRLTLLAALALLLSAAPRARAQDRQLLDDVSAGSTITTSTVAQLSFEGLDVAPDVLARVFRLPGGGWGVSSAMFPGVVQRFDSAGAPAGTLGRSGHGPGEFGGEVFAVSMRGELWVVDPRNARLSIFTTDLRLAEDRRLDVKPVFLIAPARDGRSVLVSGSAGAEDMYYAVARVSREPAADVFGEPLGRHPVPVSQSLVRRRMAAETAGGEVWAVAMTGGSIDVLRSRDLSLMAHLQLPGKEMAQEASWHGDPDERPAPRLVGVTADSAGLLWVTFGVADSTWTPGLDPQASVEQNFDTRVLAIDPAKRAIVGQVQLDRVCLPVQGHVISCVDEVGQTIRLVALRLEQHVRATQQPSHLAIVLITAGVVVLIGLVVHRAFFAPRRRASREDVRPPMMDMQHLNEI
ncbi:MAG TPA: hypothetical protein VFS08_18450 [Gemmatimonadaceae bacterium]|nr:hypothetical protein [Gemmatimonadaceae bacterium]